MNRTVVSAIVCSVLAFTTVAAAGCTGGADKASGGTIEGTWQLVTYQEGSELKEVPSAASIHATFEDGRVSGRALNTYSAPYTASSDGALKIGEVTSTMMAGPQEIMDAEQSYFEALRAATGFTATDTGLTLYDDQGATLLVYTKSDQSLTGTEWKVTGYNNGKQAVQSIATGSEITLTFSEDGTVSGNSGVNTYTGQYTTSGTDEISVGPLATTKMAGSPELMEQEQRYLKALEASVRYELAPDMLTLRDASGATQVTAKP